LIFSKNTPLPVQEFSQPKQNPSLRIRVSKKREAQGPVEHIPDEEQEWRSTLDHILTKELDAATFERPCFAARLRV
jgi:hypothetical protein